MAGKKQYVAVVPLVIAKEEQGRDLYFYQGATLSDDVTSESLKALLEQGFVAESDVPAEQPEGESDESKDEKPSDRWSNEKLTAYAAEHSIDLGTASTKKELLAAIAAGGPAQ